MVQVQLPSKLGIMARHCCCHLSWLCWVGFPGPQSVSCNKIQMSSEVDTSPSSPSIFWCNQRGLVEGGQLHRVELERWDPLPPEPRATESWCLLVIISALGLVGFLPADYRVLLWFLPALSYSAPSGLACDLCQ